MKFLLRLFFFLPVLCSAQNRLELQLKDSANSLPLSYAAVRLDDSLQTGQSNESGIVAFQNIANGNHSVNVYLTGYKKEPFYFTITHDTSIVIFVSSSSEELEEVIVTSTRTNKRIEDEAQRIEVVGKDELDEESTIIPDNVGSLLGDMAGLQLQQTSQVTGSSTIRVQGLGEQYTQIRRDGLPLFDDFSGNIGFLDIPPLDLRQVEIIKGPSSVLYGEGAIAGMINLISCEPADEAKLTALVNVTNTSKYSFDFFQSTPKRKLSNTLFASVTTQQAKDMNDDGFSDQPEQISAQVHPEFFIYGKNGNKIRVGFSSYYTDLKGGDMKAINGEGDSLHSFFEKDKTFKNSIDFIFTSDTKQSSVWTIKAMAGRSDRDFNSSIKNIKSGSSLAFLESMYSIKQKDNTSAFGVNLNYNSFQPTQEFYGADALKEQITAGLFIQDDWQITTKLSLQSGLRVDLTNTQKTIVLPSLSALYKWSDKVTSRIGGGAGYRILQPFNEEALLNSDTIYLPDNIIENSNGYSGDVNYKTFRGKTGFSLNQSFFLTTISNFITQDKGTFTNTDGLLRTQGSETYILIQHNNAEIYLGYSYIYANYKNKNIKVDLPYSAQNRFATVFTMDINEHWKYGIEASYTGNQKSDAQSTIKGFWFTAFMAQFNTGDFSLTMNIENLNDFKQYDREALYTGSMTHPQFRYLWASTTGRVISLSLRYRI